MDREERNAAQRMRRKASGNANTKKYEKTKKGFLMRLYRNIESRCSGIQKQKYHLYEGKGLNISRDKFYDVYLTDGQLNKLFAKWENSGHDRKLTPSLDRIDSGKGYLFDNLEWVTHSENSRRGAIARNK